MGFMRGFLMGAALTTIGGAAFHQKVERERANREMERAHEQLLVSEKAVDTAERSLNLLHGCILELKDYKLAERLRNQPPLPTRRTVKEPDSGQ